MNQPQTLHELYGVLILMGGMVFILGVLLFDMMMMTVGSGMIMMGAFLTLCSFEKQYQMRMYQVDHSVVGAEKEDDADA